MDKKKENYTIVTLEEKNYKIWVKILSTNQPSVAIIFLLQKKLKNTFSWI